jgi:hypothetical protein
MPWLVNQPVRLAALLGFMMVGLVFSSLALGQFTPPRDWLLYWAYQPQSSTWYLLDLERRFRTPMPTMQDIYRVAFSPQHHIAYAQISAADRDDILLRDVLAGGQPPLPIVTGIANIRYDGLQWSPDGRYLAFEAGRRSRFTNLHIWDGQAIQMILPPELANRAQLEGVAWNTQNELAFIARRSGQQAGQPYPSELYVWDGMQTINLSQTTDQNEFLPTWSQDGRLAFFSERDTREDRYDVMIWDGHLSPDGIILPAAFHRAFSQFDLGLSNIEWSAAGDLTVSFAAPDDDGFLQIYRWEGQEPVNISQNPGVTHGGQRWSDDGHWTVATFPPLQQFIQVRDPDNAVILNTEGMYRGAWSATGKLLFCKQMSTGWALMAWDGEQLVHLVQGGVIYALLPGGHPLYCATG